jgi:hypothetical protein
LGQADEMMRDYRLSRVDALAAVINDHGQAAAVINSADRLSKTTRLTVAEVRERLLAMAL